jgi:hypothetical protein
VDNRSIAQIPGEVADMVEDILDTHRPGDLRVRLRHHRWSA